MLRADIQKFSDIGVASTPPSFFLRRFDKNFKCMNTIKARSR